MKPLYLILGFVLGFLLGTVFQARHTKPACHEIMVFKLPDSYSAVFNHGTYTGKKEWKL